MNQNFVYALLVAGIFCSCTGSKKEKVTAQTAANEPTIKRGETYYYDRSKEPSRFDLICFSGPVPGLEGKFPMIYRLVGLPGDTIQLKGGDLVVNGAAVDNKLALKHNYYVSQAAFKAIEGAITVDDNFPLERGADSILVPLDDQYVQVKHLPARRLVADAGKPDSSIGSQFAAGWNQDHFGPVVVPEGCYFVLGDNRHNAWDSRYRGFIKKADLLGTVIADK